MIEKNYPLYFAFDGFILWALSERLFHLSGNHQKNEIKNERRSYWMLSFTWYFMAGVSFYDGFLRHWTISVIEYRLLRWFGVVAIILGLVLRFFARKELGKQYSTYIATSSDHSLITTGIYNVIRHPAYLGLLCLFLGIPLAAWSFPGLIISMMGLIALIFRIKIEEAALHDWFGEKFSIYTDKTWRIIPWIW